MAATTFAFVPTGNDGKPHPSHRHMVRHVAMKGRNLRVGVRPVVPPITLAELTASDDSAQEHTHSSHARRRRRGHPVADLGPRQVAPRVSPTLPVPLAAELDSVSYQALHTVLQSASNTWYPYDICVDFEVMGQTSFRWLQEDPAYLHSTLFLIFMFQDQCMRRRLGYRTCHHLGKTIAAVNRRIAEQDGRLCQSTIAAIGTLIILTAAVNDETAARAHKQGLYSIIQALGGLKALRDNPSLHLRLSRVDFAYFMFAGHEPFFFTDNDTQAHFSNGVHRNVDIGVDTPSVPDAVWCLADPRVATVFQEMQQLSSVLKTLTTAKEKLHHLDFQSAVCSIQYQLLQLHGKLDDALSECILFALLAFMATPFSLPVNGIRYPYVTARFRQAFDAMMISRTPSSSEWDKDTDELVLWLLTIAATSLFGTEDAWLQERWQAHVSESLTWTEAKKTLARFVWIDTIHGRVGELAFARLNNGEVEDGGGGDGFWGSGWAICPYQV